MCVCVCVITYGLDGNGVYLSVAEGFFRLRPKTREHELTHCNRRTMLVQQSYTLKRKRAFCLSDFTVQCRTSLDGRLNFLDICPSKNNYITSICPKRPSNYAMQYSADFFPQITSCGSRRKTDLEALDNCFGFVYIIRGSAEA